MPLETLRDKFSFFSILVALVLLVFIALCAFIPARGLARRGDKNHPLVRTIQTVSFVLCQLFGTLTIYLLVLFDVLTPVLLAPVLFVLLCGSAALYLRETSEYRELDKAHLEVSVDMDIDSAGDNSQEFGLEQMEQGHYMGGPVTIRESIATGLRNRRLAFAFTVFVALLLSFGLFGAGDICVAENPWHFSTRLTRTFAGPSCSQKEICHIYFTLSDDPTVYYVNFHIGFSPEGGKVHLLSSEFGDAIWNRGKAHCDRVPAISEEVRYVCWGTIIDSRPSVTLYVKAVVELPALKDDQERMVESKVVRLLTLPGDNAPVRFVQGGDIETGGEGSRLWEVARSHQPHFSVLGGDIAYANAFPSCYRRWDEFLWNYADTMVTASNHLVPMVLAIGNHEAGGFQSRRDNIPFFARYFMQDSTRESSLSNYTTISPQDRSLYHSHVVGGGAAVIALDAWVVDRPGDVQGQWLRKTLTDLTQLGIEHIVLAYHVSLYPSLPEQVQEITKAARQAWLPLIDEFHVDLCLESHYHLYKRSRPLYNDTVVDVSKGTLYIGDGAMGVPPRGPHFPFWYTAVMARQSFVTLVEIDGTNLTVSALAPDGSTFDRVTKLGNKRTK